MIKRWKIVVLISLSFVAIAIWYVVLTRSDGKLKIVFLNIGQGDAIFIETPTGAQILIDGGAGSRVLGELAAVMPIYDRSIDVVIATHTDADHIGGLTEVLRRYDVSMVIENGMTADTKIWRELDALIKDEGSVRHIAVAGQRLVLGGGAHLDILGPAFGERDEPTSKANDVMIVTRLVYGQSEVLLTGDIERDDEIRLLASGVDLQSDVLKVAHHGSKNSSTDLFLQRVAPDVAVISVGESNRYGHPHKEALDRLAKTGARLLRTDINGRLCFVAGSSGWQGC
ncbi:MAG: ComEC/Rec2 family competence protein [Patescibacteria group bacterium]